MVNPAYAKRVGWIKLSRGNSDLNAQSRHRRATFNFYPVKINAQKLNWENSGVDLQAFVPPHPLTGHKHAKLKSVEVTILSGGEELDDATSLA